MRVVAAQRLIGARWWLSLALAVVLCLLGAQGAMAGPVLTTLGESFPTGPGPRSVAFSEDGKLLATANNASGVGEDRSVSMFFVRDGGVLSPVGSPPDTRDPAQSVAFSPGGRFLAVASEGSNPGDGSVSMFSVSSSGASHRIGTPTPADDPRAVAFSPRGDLLVVRGVSSISVFSVSQDGMLARLGDPTPAPTAVGTSSIAFSSGGWLAIANSGGDSVSVFSVSADGKLTPVPGPAARTGDRPESVAFSPDGKLLATANSGNPIAAEPNGSVSVFAVLAEGKLSPGMQTRNDLEPRAVAFSPDGKLLATANLHNPKAKGTTGSVSTYSASAGGELTEVRSPTTTGFDPRSVAFSPRGQQLLATADYTGATVSVFSVSAGGALTRVGSPKVTVEHPDAVAFSPAQTKRDLFASVDKHSNFVSMFYVSSGGVLYSLPFRAPTGERPHSMAFSPDGGLLAITNSEGNSVSMFSVSDSGALEEIGSPTPTGPGPGSVAFGRNGELLAVVNTGDDSVSVFSVPADGKLRLVDSQTPRGAESVAFSPGGELLVTANDTDHSVSVFSVLAGGVLKRVGSPIRTGHGPVSVAFSPDGGLLATANSLDHSVSVFSVPAGGVLSPVGSIPTGRDPVSLAFSPDGRLLATADSGDHSLSLFLVSASGVLTAIGSPTPVSSPTSEQSGPFSVAFSPKDAFSQGRMLATANGNTVSMFSLAAPALDTSITSGPPPETAESTARFTFEANYPSTLECRLDTGAFEPCSSPMSYAGLAEGVHTFAVRATDLVGNVADAAASRSWKVDLTAPVVALAAPAEGASSLRDTVEFSWTLTDNLTGIGGYELWIDGALSRTVSGSCGDVCSATPAAALTDGSHSWQVRAVDGVGNGAASVSRTFTVDAAPPSAFALTGPADDAATTSRRPVLSWQAAADAGVGVVGYDVLLDGQLLASVGASTTSFEPGAELADGAHRWQVVARDGHGYERASAIGRFIVDTTAPAAALTAAPNPALTGRIVTFDAAGSSDAGTGIVRYEWDLDGDGTFEHETGATATTAQTFADPGTFAVQVRVTDRVGLSAVARIDQRITAETHGSGQFGTVSINDGARFTNDPKVTIRATWPSFASQMLISNDGGFKTAQTFGLQADTAWTLDSSGAERLPKTVYVRFVRGLTVSETYTDDIILDQSAPSVTSAQVSPKKKATPALLRVRARDRGLAGLSSVQVSNNRRRPNAKFRSYRATMKLTRLKGERPLKITKPIYVRVRDHAGNLSAWRAAHRATKRTGRTSRG